jgi:hypothetical protein
LIFSYVSANTQKNLSQLSFRSIVGFSSLDLRLTAISRLFGHIGELEFDAPCPKHNPLSLTSLKDVVLAGRLSNLSAQVVDPPGEGVLDGGGDAGKVVASACFYGREGCVEGLV